MRPLSLILLILILALPSYAIDGVLEINQTCAVHTGCLPGDAPGLPVTISQPGAYVLTSGLTGPAADTLIDVQASGVDIDLNGQQVAGEGFDARGQESGIHAGPGLNAVSVRNGYVTNTYVALRGHNSVIRDLRSRVLVRCGSHCSVIDSHILTAFDDGALICGDDCTVRGSRVSGDDFGLSCGDRCRVESSALSGQDGLFPLLAGDDAQVTDSLIEGENSAATFGDRALIENSQFKSTFTFAPLIVGAASRVKNVIASPGGIVVGDASSISEATIDLNQSTTVAIEVTSGTARYSDSTIRSPGGSPTAAGAGNLLDGGGNLCNGTTTCP